MTTMPPHLELLEADLGRVAELRVRQIRRRRRTVKAAAILVALLIMAGAGLAASGVGILGWLEAADRTSARFSVDPSRTYRGPVPASVGCDDVSEGSFTCRPGGAGARRVYTLLMTTDAPARFSRAGMLEQLDSSEQNGWIDEPRATELRSLIRSVPGDFFEKMNVLASLQSVGSGIAVDRGGGEQVELVPPEGVPFLVVCDRVASGGLGCRKLAAAVAVPVGAPVYALTPTADWVERPLLPKDEIGGGREVRALIEAVWGRPLAPEERRLLLAISTASLRSGGTTTVSGTAPATEAG